MLEQVTQGGGGVTVTASVQEMFRCCAERHGLVENGGGRWSSLSALVIL